MHIIYIGRITKKLKDPFRVNNFQSLWALVAIMPFVISSDTIQWGPLSAKALWGLLILAGACSVLAFFIQVRSQRVLSDSTASMLFLLESPYAFFFAYLLMGDRLSVAQGIGGVLIVLAAIGTVLFERPAVTTKTQSR
ncbi:MAG: EamA family transporter [Proteobacteria bacterium]|nr:MAG: EamA family transporter [Pseudomonadota bacterium]